MQKQMALFAKSLCGLAISTLIVTGVTSAADAQTASPSAGNKSMSGMDMSQGAKTPAAKGYADAMAKMNKNMMVPSTGNADVDFAQGMLPHHQGAIDMARVELEYGNDPQMRGLARRIVAAQEREIAFMHEWLAKHHK